MLGENTPGLPQVETHGTLHGLPGATPSRNAAEFPIQHMKRILFAPIFSAILLILATGCGSSPEGADSGPASGTESLLPGPWAEARLITADTHFIPGRTQDVGISFDIAEGWHLYGNGASDTGYAPQIRLELPPGFTAGEILWPAPHRKTWPATRPAPQDLASSPPRPAPKSKFQPAGPRGLRGPRAPAGCGAPRRALTCTV